MAGTGGPPKESIGDLSNLVSAKPEIPKAKVSVEPGPVKNAVRAGGEKVKKATKWAGKGWRESGDKRWYSIIPLTIAGAAGIYFWLLHDKVSSLINNWSVANELRVEGLTNDETARMSNILADSETRAEYLLSGKEEIKTYLENMVVLRDGFDSERKRRYEKLGINPQQYPGRDMDVILENSQEWYAFMKANMLKLREEIKDAGITGINIDTGDGLANYLILRHKNEDGVSDGSYSLEAIYKAWINESQLTPADAIILKNYVKNILKKEWRSLSGETSMVEQVAEMAKINAVEVLGVSELLKGEAKYAPDQTQALIRAYDGLEMVEINKPNVGSFGPESAILLGMFVMNVANAKISSLGKNWLNQLGVIGNNAKNRILGKTSRQ